MTPIKKNEQGFAVEVIVVAAVVVAMIALGWYAYANRPGTGKSSTPQSSSSSSSSSGAWRDPSIAQEIAVAGQAIQSQKQVTVSAQVDWVDTGLQVAAGQHMWVTTSDDGKWSGNPQLFPYSDANGLATYPGGYKIDANANVLSMIGFVGSTPPQVAEQSISVGAPAGGPGGITNAGFFEPGNTLKNFTPTQSGKVWLRNNDNTNIMSDSGQQVAQVWVTSSK
ncbi:MAG TPA: hypothetical protein VIJ68_01355 [Candidatus Saccharimonadales bacterium]